MLRTKVLRPDGPLSMAGETVITVIGNLTADPELRFTPSGAAVANFTVASTPRTFDRTSQEWKDGEALFLRCNDLAAGGRERRRVPHPRCAGHRQRAAQAALVRHQEGEKRTVIELEVDEIGPSLRYATAKVTEASRGSTVAAAVSAVAAAAAGGGGRSGRAVARRRGRATPRADSRRRCPTNRPSDPLTD